jgi:hypothetical protein
MIDLNDDKNLRKLVVKYVKHKDLELAAHEIGTTEDDVEEFFMANPKAEEKFDELLYERATRMGYRKLRAGLDEAIGRLNELVSDGDEDQTNAFKSASKILDVWSRLDGAKKKEEDEDDLDAIYKQIMDNE